MREVLSGRGLREKTQTTFIPCARNGDSMLGVHVPEHHILVVVSKAQVCTQDCPLVHRGTRTRVSQNLLGVRVPCFYNNSACALEVMWQGNGHF